MNTDSFKDVLNKFMPDDNSISLLADYLGYEVGKNPLDPDGEWKILFSKRVANKNNGVIAIKPEKELNEDTSTMEVRKLSQAALEFSNTLGSSFYVNIIAFIGEKRVVFFKKGEANRDIRLDLNPDNVDKTLYINNLNQLKDENILIEEDIFGLNGGQVTIRISDDVFKRELTTHFLTMINYYRKKMSELITGSSKIRNKLAPLLTEKAKFYLNQGQPGLINLVDEESYRSALSVIVDTIILRQLMRRFLEAYYGEKSFEVDDITLGVGSGTLDEAIASTVKVATQLAEEKEIKKLNQKQTSLTQEISLFDDLFDDEEIQKTSQIEFIDQTGPQTIQELTKKAQKQFELAYAGDLYTGSVSKVINQVEQTISKEMPDFQAKFWNDTNSGNYSFRYEDMPPESLEKQYEQSMSKNVQIKVENDENGTPIPKVFYGTDEQEQKEKGAYYTDKRFVDYMIEKAVKPEFMRRKDKINQAIKTGSQEQMKKALDYLLDMKVADFTAGGGSFLRGAFIFLADQFKTIYELEIPQALSEQYPFYNQDDGQYQWEKYILEHMIYGVDIDYKAIIISSLTLTLSSLEHHPKDIKLPQLIGRTLIHQNALINSVPYYKRKEVFGKYKKDIAKLIKLKREDFVEFNKLRKKLQDKVISNVGEISKKASFLHIEAIELNLPEIYFNEDGSLNEKGGMDVVVGNPPWEKWKPADDDFFNPYAPDVFTDRKKVKKQVKEQAKRKVLQNSRINEKYEQYKERYALGSKYFKDDDNYRYQSWKVNNKSTGGDRNLYILALERFTQLAKPDLDAAILVPDNLVTDAGTTGIRHLLFDNYRVNEFLSFDNGKGIFESVHRSYKFAVLAFDGEERSTSELKTFFYKRDLEDLNKESEKIPYSIDIIKKYSPEEYALFEPKDIDEYHAYIKIRDKFEKIGERDLFNLSNDFHKTNDSKLFRPYNKDKDNLVPLYEGKFMHQFVIKPDEITEGIDREVVANKIGDDLNEYRLAIRTIASATNMRTLVATLLPPMTTAVNSLHVQRNSKEVSLPNKLFYLGMLNSYILDFSLRTLVTTNINKKYLIQLPMPLSKEVDCADDIILLTKELLKENTGYYQDLDELVPGDKYQGLDHDKLVAKLNALVMLEFGLNRQEILKIMDSFKSAKHTKDVEDMTQLIIDEIQEVGEQDGQ